MSNTAQTKQHQEIPAEAYAQRAIMAALSDGLPHSVRELVQEAKLSDPRTAIRQLRRKGVEISDQWLVNSNGKRYKVYFITQHNL